MPYGTVSHVPLLVLYIRDHGVLDLLALQIHQKSLSFPPTQLGHIGLIQLNRKIHRNLLGGGGGGFKFV